MRIALCIKQVLDITGHFRIADRKESLNNEALIPIANPADLAGLALAREAFGSNAQIKALTVGSYSTESILRTCLSLGADEAIRIWDKEIEKKEHDSDALVSILSSTIKTLGFDLIICGTRGLSGGSGYVGPAIAEYLGIPSICSVSHIEFSNDKKKIICHRRLERGDREVVSVTLPAVITVDSGIVDIPYAPLGELIAAERQKITEMNSEEIGLIRSQITPGSGKLLYYIPPKPRTKKVAQSSAALTPAQKMQQLMGGGAKKGRGAIEGDPQQGIAEIVKFLESKGILAP